MDQRNRLREAIEAGDVVFGARAATAVPAVVELYGVLGLDFVWLDFEHGGPSPWDAGVVAGLCRAAEVGGTELLARLPSGDPALIRKVLDAGVRNVLVPRVDSAEEVRAAVEATRFVYEGAPGERGKAGGRANAWGAADDYVATEDASVCLGVMIEKRSAIDALDDILAVPDLGFVFVGPSDLSVQLGHPTDKTHPDVVAQVEAVHEACRAAGVPIGSLPHDPAKAIEAVAAGHQLLRIGGELEAAKLTLTARLDEIRAAR